MMWQYCIWQQIAHTCYPQCILCRVADVVSGWYDAIRYDTQIFNVRSKKLTDSHVYHTRSETKRNNDMKIQQIIDERSMSDVKQI